MANSVTIAISEPALEDKNGDILSYTILLTDVLSGSDVVQTINVGQQFELSSLTPFTTYSYVVAASTVNGTGPYSQSTTFTTNETGTCIFTCYSCV